MQPELQPVVPTDPAVEPPTVPIPVSLAAELDAATDSADAPGSAPRADAPPADVPPAEQQAGELVDIPVEAAAQVAGDASTAAVEAQADDSDADRDWWRGGPEVRAEIDEEHHEHEGPRRHWWNRRREDRVEANPFGEPQLETRPVIPIEEREPRAETVLDAPVAAQPEPTAAAQVVADQAEAAPTPESSDEPQLEAVDPSVDATADETVGETADEAVAVAETVDETAEEEFVPLDLPTPVADWQPPANFTFPGGGQPRA